VPTPKTFAFTGPVPDPAAAYPRDPQGNQVVNFAREQVWLAANPSRVGNVHVFDLSDRNLPNFRLDAFVVSTRVLDPRAADGWRVELYETSTGGFYNAGLLDRWREAQGDPALENALLLGLLAGDAEDTPAARAILRGLVLPDVSDLDEVWRPDFEPVTFAAASGLLHVMAKWQA
jgi:hypothetical protein